MFLNIYKIVIRSRYFGSCITFSSFLIKLKNIKNLKFKISILCHIRVYPQVARFCAPGCIKKCCQHVRSANLESIALLFKCLHFASPTINKVPKAVFFTEGCGLN